MGSLYNNVNYIIMKEMELKKENKKYSYLLRNSSKAKALVLFELLLFAQELF